MQLSRMGSTTIIAGEDADASKKDTNSVVTVKFVDTYEFTVEGNLEDVNVLNEVRERVRQQWRAWLAVEESKGEDWYLKQQKSEGITVSSLRISVLANSILLKRLIRKGIPPVLRPKVWLSVSGALKKRSTVPESYYADLTKAVEGKVTPATLQIDHVGFNFPFFFIRSRLLSHEFSDFIVLLGSINDNYALSP